MLTHAVESYIAMRRACGFAFESEGTCLRGSRAASLWARLCITIFRALQLLRGAPRKSWLVTMVDRRP
jgi:hypothetical protein